MAAKYPRFILTLNGQQAGVAYNHDEAWMQSMALWRPGCVVGCEPTEVNVAEDEPDEQAGEAAQGAA